MRRNSTLRYLLCLFLTCIPFNIFSLDVNYSLSFDERWLIVDVDIINKEDITHSIEEGQKGELFFQFRIYKKVKGFYAFFGDELIFSTSIYHRAYKHLFFNEYVIETEAGYHYEKDLLNFLGNFYRLKNYRLFDMRPYWNNGEYYVLCRGILNPVKLESPLHLISIFSTIGHMSDWKKSDLKFND